MPLPPYIRRDPSPIRATRSIASATRPPSPAAQSRSAPRARPGLDAAAAGAADAGPADADAAGAVAAPTAGLHFTSELLAAVAARGVVIARLRLDVGEGTFRPLRGERLDEHVMHEERYEIPSRRRRPSRSRGGAAIAWSRWVRRSCARSRARCSPAAASLRVGRRSTRLFIRPGPPLQRRGALLTNFHQPRSTLLVLVSAFADWTRCARPTRTPSRAATASSSYGDAMFIA